MITGYFGLPGSGKTSLLSRLAMKEQKRMNKGKSPYKHIYTTFYCEGFEKIEWQDLGKYWIHDALILIDEVTLEQDSRDWKSLQKCTKEFITLHRHFGCDIVYALQDWSRCEKTLRECTYRLFYVTPTIFPGLIRCYQIFRTIAINEYIGDLIMGYRFAEGFGEQINDLHFYNVRKAWKLFDTHDLQGFDKKPKYKSIIWGEKKKGASDGRASFDRLTDKKNTQEIIIDLSKKGG